MRLRTTYILIAIFVILGAFILLFERPRKEESVLPEENVALGVNKDDVKKIEITKGDSSTVLAKMDDEWQLMFNEGKLFKANNSLVDNLLGKMSSLKAGDLVSENPAKQDIFEVGEATGAHLIMYGDGENKLADVFVGKRGTTMQSNYIRRQGSNKVYSVNSYLLDSVDLPKGQWMDKTIVSFDKEKLSELKISANGHEYMIAKQPTAVSEDGTAGTSNWLKKDMASGKDLEIDQSAMDSLVGLLSEFMADDIEMPEEGSSRGDAEPSARVSVTLNDGSSQSFSLWLNESDASVEADGKEGMLFKVMKADAESIIKAGEPEEEAAE